MKYPKIKENWIICWKIILQCNDTGCKTIEQRDREARKGKGQLWVHWAFMLKLWLKNHFLKYISKKILKINLNYL